MVVDRDGNLPEKEGVGGNRIKGRFLLFFDEVLEGADGFGAGNFDREYVSQFVALHNTVEFEV
jgi:hypothetical protein